MQSKATNYLEVSNDFKKRFLISTLTDEQTLKQCNDFITSHHPTDNINAEHISRAYKISGNILYKSERYQEALKHYIEQKNSIEIKLRSDSDPVFSRLLLADAYFNIGKTNLTLEDFESAKENFISAWKMNDDVISQRRERNEDISTYNSRLEIFSNLVLIAQKQNDYTALLGLCKIYAEKLKFPGVCLPIKNYHGTRIGTLKSNALSPMEFKCLLSINVFKFLSIFNLKENKNDEALTNLNFALEKINEFELFNRRFKDKVSIDQTKNLNLAPEIVTDICTKGGRLCLLNDDTKKFKEYILKGMEYFEKLTDQQLKNNYLKFLFENIDRINSISPTNSEQDLEITSKIHRHICKSLSHDMDYDKTMQLFTSFHLSEPPTENIKLYKIFIDKQHHISQTHKIRFGEDQVYNDLVREEYGYLIKFGNLIKNNEDFSNRDMLEIFSRITDKAKTLGSKFDRDRNEFEKLKTKIDKLASIENASILKIHQNTHEPENNYEISGSSYVLKQEGARARAGAGGFGAGVAGAVVRRTGVGALAEAGAIDIASGSSGYAGAIFQTIVARSEGAGAGARAGGFGTGGAGAGGFGAGGFGTGGAGAGGFGAGGARSEGALAGAGAGGIGTGGFSVIRPQALPPIASSQLSFGGPVQQQASQISSETGAFKRPRSAIQVPISSSSTPDFSALEILANLATAGQSAINSSSPSGQPSGGSASSANPPSKRSRNA